jgi:exodeoxyribonuclease V alpha subunit
MTADLATLGKSGRLRRADVALGEWLARAFSDAPPEAALAAALAARAVADGHSALVLDVAQDWFDGLEGDGKPLALPDIPTWLSALKNASAVHVHDGNKRAELVPLVLDAQGRVYLRRYFGYEWQLAQALIARAGFTDGKHHDDAAESGDIDPEQRHAIDTALSHHFTLVTGGPGSGKTQGVLRMLATLAGRARARGEGLRIALAAPTGKAAARLRESVLSQLAVLDLSEEVAALLPRDASTVHGLIGLSPRYPAPRFDRASPLPFDVVVVDEVSMVDLPLMAKLVDAVPTHARLILLGDPDQLSAVEAGNVLGALVDAARSDPLRDCHVALTRSHRFGVDSALGLLARAIAVGDADAALDACARETEVVLADTTRMSDFLDDAAEAYRPVLDAGDPEAALRAARDFRVLTALRRGPSGCVAIDHAIAARLQRTVGVRADAQWWRGRLILVTANRPELRLFNGDTGVTWPDADGTMKAWFDGPDGVPRALPVAALPSHEGAFALTVHKAQGSEFERVALITGPDSAVLTRELLYTGITRARAGITLYATPDTLRAGIARRTLRMTGLVDRLREAAMDPNSIASSLPGKA